MPADPTYTPVLVKIPLTFDLSNIDVELFGQSFTISGNVIVVTDPLLTTSFYNAGNSTAWIEYKQDISENNFRAQVKDQASAIAIEDDVKASVYLNAGSTYDIARKGVKNLDASAIFQDGGAWDSYHSLQDFVLSYFADKILGHPGALAAISNDSTIRTKVTQQFPEVIKQVRDFDEDKIKLIVQQIMNQDLRRFDTDEKGVFEPLRWYDGDRVHLQIALLNNSYSLKTPANDPSSVSGGIINAAQNSYGQNSGNPVSATPDYYVLEFTLRDAQLD
jgi:hypothetical protein